MRQRQCVTHPTQGQQKGGSTAASIVAMTRVVTVDWACFILCLPGSLMTNLHSGCQFSSHLGDEVAKIVKRLNNSLHFAELSLDKPTVSVFSSLHECSSPENVCVLPWPAPSAHAGTHPPASMPSRPSATTRAPAHGDKPPCE